VLSLAARLKREPLRRTEVWLVCSGCEEVACYGAADFVRRHRAELADGYFIVLDTIGGPGAGPCYTASETFLLTAKSDGGLIKLAEAIAARRPELDAYSRAFHGAYTEQSLSIKVGLKSLAFVNVRRDGVLPNWHQPSDVFANVDPDVLDRTETFVWELLQEIDSAA
jgi:Zn-dependent M28 family amino/carboxypeptidase